MRVSASVIRRLLCFGTCLGLSMEWATAQVSDLIDASKLSGRGVAFELQALPSEMAFTSGGVQDLAKLGDFDGDGHDDFVLIGREKFADDEFRSPLVIVPGRAGLSGRH